MKKLILLLSLLTTGVVVVWVFGIESGESLFGSSRRAEDKARAAAAARASDTTEFESPTGTEETELALYGAVIPVREESADDPDVRVLKYLLRIGETTGGSGKKINAREVQIDIYNKMPKPDEQLVATVRGDHALIIFLSAVDATAGFQGAAVDAMTLTENVLVEYFDESGVPVSRLETDHLDLNDAVFHVPGRGVITQAGLHVEGDALTYDKVNGSFVLERDILVRGTRFGLPEAAEDGVLTSDPAEGEVVKTVTCDGPFQFVPAERSAEDEAGSPKAGPAIDGALGGGILSFHGNVVGTQGDRRLECDALDISLEDAAPPPAVGEPADGDAPESGGLNVGNAVARGSPERPARLVSPEGTMRGETLLLEKEGDEQVVTLLGHPAIEDARLGDSESASTFQAGALTRIVFRPLPPTTTAPNESSTSDEAAGDELASDELADGTEPAEEKRIRLVLEDEAFLETKSDDPESDFRIEGRHVEMTLLQAATPPTTEGGPGEDGSGEDDSGASADMTLEELVAEGDASGIFSQGTFTGDRIRVTPKVGAPAEFDLVITPNPAIELVTELEDGTRRQVSFRCEDGELSYLPPDEEGGVTQAVFEGHTVVTLSENGVTTTELEARRITIDLDDGELRQMVAVGDVEFESPRDDLSGSGERLTLMPRDDGSQQLVLVGQPAVAIAGAASEEGDSRRVEASSIEFDPETGELYARGSVEARFAGLALASVGPTDPASASDPNLPDEAGVLRSDELRVRTIAGPNGNEVVLDAVGNVDFDDPANDVRALANSLLYEESRNLVTLLGNVGAPAVLTRTKSDGDSSNQSDVSISGPRLLLDSETSVLICPEDGVVAIERDVASDDESETRSRIVARSTGRVRYAEDQLSLRDDVLVTFLENGDEVRALWCDHATVFMDEDGGGDQDESDSTTGGFERILAEGRVHVEQADPRPFVAEGRSLEWTKTDGREEVMILRGVNPQAWVVGLASDRDLRFDADWMLLHRFSEHFEAENGNFRYDQLLVGSDSGSSE